MGFAPAEFRHANGRECYAGNTPARSMGVLLPALLLSFGFHGVGMVAFAIQLKAATITSIGVITDDCDTDRFARAGDFVNDSDGANSGACECDSMSGGHGRLHLLWLWRVGCSLHSARR